MKKTLPTNLILLAVSVFLLFQTTHKANALPYIFSKQANNRCTIPKGKTVCSQTVAWKKPKNSYSHLQIYVGDTLFACAKADGQQGASWISKNFHDFWMFNATGCNKKDRVGYHIDSMRLKGIPASTTTTTAVAKKAPATTAKPKVTVPKTTAPKVTTPVVRTITAPKVSKSKSTSSSSSSTSSSANNSLVAANAPTLYSKQNGKCLIPKGSTTCSQTITWKKPNNNYSHIQIYLGDSLFVCSKVSSSKNINSITKHKQNLWMYNAAGCSKNDRVAAHIASLVLQGDVTGTTTPVNNNNPAVAREISNIKSISIVHHGGTYQTKMEYVRKQLREVRRMGFNTIWLVTPWYQLDPKPYPNPNRSDRYNEANFDELKQTLKEATSLGLKAIIGAPYHGEGWAPEFTPDKQKNYEMTCDWLNNKTVYNAFLQYYTRLLTEIEDYADSIYLMTFAEGTTYCKSMLNGRLQTDHRIQNAEKNALLFRKTLGRLPDAIPQNLRKKFLFGYHDNNFVSKYWSNGVSPLPANNSYDFVSFSNYYSKLLEADKLVPMTNLRLERMKGIFGQSAPILMGEMGAKINNKPTGSQVLVRNGDHQKEIVQVYLDYLSEKNVGYNIWGLHNVQNRTTGAMDGLFFYHDYEQKIPRPVKSLFR